MDTLTSKQRVKISLAHQEPDRVPYCEIWVNNRIISEALGRPAQAGVGSGTPHYNAIRAAMKGREAHQKFIRDAMDEHVSFCEKMGIDVVMLRIHHFLAGVYSKAYLGPNGLYDDLTIEEVGDRAFSIVHPSGFWSSLTYDDNMGTIMETDEGISEIGIPELERYVELLESRPLDLTPPFIDVLDGMKQVIESDAGRRLFVLGTADTCYPMFLHFNPIFLEAMVLAPKLIDRYMEITTEGVLVFLKAQLEMGVDGIIGTNDLAFNTGLMFSNKHFNRFIAPYLKKIVDECHRSGVPYIKHLDGNINKIVPILIDDIGVDGLHALEPTAGMDIYALKREYGDKITLWGNLDCGDLLTHGSPEEIEMEAKNLIRHLAPGGGYGFSASNAIHVGVPMDNFYTMVDVVKKYGQYPINL